MVAHNLHLTLLDAKVAVVCVYVTVNDHAYINVGYTHMELFPGFRKLYISISCKFKLKL